MAVERSPLGTPQLTISAAKKLLKSISDKISSQGRQAIMLWGPPGIGKSDLVRDLSVETNRKFVDIRLSTIDPVDLRGLPQIDRTRELTKWLPPDFLPQDDGNSGILFLDEINAAPPSVQAAAYQLILDRRLGDYVIPQDWIVIAAGNRISDRSVAYRLPSALANRFTHLEIVVSNEEWVRWAWRNNVDPLIISFIRHQPDLLLQFDPDSSEVAFPTPRSWHFASSLVDVRDQDLTLYLKGLHGTVGSAAAQQFLAFLRHRDRLPDPNEILDGSDYTAPVAPDAQYVLLGSLISSLLENPTQERIANYFLFADRYTNGPSADFSVVLVKELVQAFENRDQEIDGKKLKKYLSQHPSMKKWINENIEVLS